MLRFTLLSVLALTLALNATPAQADDTQLKVKVGDAFPVVKLPATQIESIKKDVKEVSIEDMKGKFVVVAFYPKALTPGCTAECNGLQKLLAEFPKETVVLGASADGLQLNGEFTEKYKFAFPLWCDENKTLIKALGILSPRGTTSQRVTFLVDKEGKIAKIYTKVAPKDHPAEVLKDVKELAAK
ncbi:MAG: peroxiredoxin [Gemmataceae bacterium]